MGGVERVRLDIVAECLQHVESPLSLESVSICALDTIDLFPNSLSWQNYSSVEEYKELDVIIGGADVAFKIPIHLGQILMARAR